MAFTPAELIDLRRFAGYAALRGGTATTVEGLAFEAALAGLSYDEEDSIRVAYLTRLQAAEATIVSVMDTADTKKAAVWERNPNALAEATAALAYWRQGLVDLLGLPLGPFVSAGGPPIPAIFTV